MRQYKQWHSVATPDYKAYWGKSYGANDRTETTIHIGSSSRNSFQFLRHETKRIEREDGRVQFSFLVNGVPVVEAVFNPKTKNLEGNVVSYLNKREWLND